MARNTIRNIASIGLAAISIGLAGAGTAAAAPVLSESPSAGTVAGSTGTGSATGSASALGCFLDNFLYDTEPPALYAQCHATA